MSLRIHVSTVERTREKFVVGGLEYALEDRPHPPKPRKLDGKQEAFLVATACSNAPEGRTRWTMKLLADQFLNKRLCLKLCRKSESGLAKRRIKIGIFVKALRQSQKFYSMVAESPRLLAVGVSIVVL